MRLRLSLALFIVALVLTAVVQIRNAAAPFTYRHGFISAVFATNARMFARIGILRLGGVPVDNNPPIGPDDAYPHWPPLLPAVISISFRLFGVSEVVGHLWMLVIEILTALLVFAIAREWLGFVGGALAGFFWLTMPVAVHYGHVIVPESLAILFMVAAVFAFLRLHRWLLALASCLAVWACWEASLLPVGLWAAALIVKRDDYRRMAAVCTAATILALIAVVGCYALHNPIVFLDTIQTARFRMGLSPMYSHVLLANSTERYVGLEESVSRIVVNFARMLGLFGGGALVLLALSSPKGSAVILYGLGTPWLLWCILMRNHMAVHDIEMQLAAPLAAIALAWVAVGVIPRREHLLWKDLAIGTFVAALIVAQPWLLGTDKSPEDPQQILGFAAGIRRATNPGAVVLSPLVSTIPVYYSERHIVRNIPDEARMQRVLPYVRREYPAARLYWATPLFSPPWVVVREVR